LEREHCGRAPGTVAILCPAGYHAFAIAAAENETTAFKTGNNRNTGASIEQILRNASFGYLRDFFEHDGRAHNAIINFVCSK
jgi:hypothetical protein